MSALELLACVALIAISAFMSASEVAIFSLSRFQIRSLKERTRPVHRRVKALLADPSGLLITILVINETVNVSLSAVIASWLSRTQIPPWIGAHRLPPWAVHTALGLLVTTPVVLFFCEITPKVIAARANRLVATLTSRPLTLTYELARPVRILLKRIVTTVAKWSAGNAPQLPSGGPGSGAILRESDFLLMIEEGHREGAIQENELELIRKVFELDDTSVQGLYTPLAQVQTLPAHIPLRAALAALRSQRFSRIPAVSPDRKRIVGIIYAKDLLRAKLGSGLMDDPVSSIMRRPLFVPPTMRLNSLFRKFKAQRTHMAVVQGPGDQALGVVTMNDVLEELFEELLESDEQAPGGGPPA